MKKSLYCQTLDNDITLEQALEEEDNMLRRLTFMDKRIDLLTYLLDHQYEIQSLMAYHLKGKKVEDCRLAPIGEWEHGSHNICLPVSIKGRQGHGGERVIVRFPLSYKLGEDLFPDNAIEKLRSEAATYIWIRSHCPEIPFPRLLGFAFEGDQCVGGFITIDHTSLANVESSPMLPLLGQKKMLILTILNLLYLFIEFDYLSTPGSSLSGLCLAPHTSR